MKSFLKPDYEIVRFGSNIVTNSPPCGCFDGEFDYGAGSNCTGDGAECSCRTNYNPEEPNCITPQA